MTSQQITSELSNLILKYKFLDEDVEIIESELDKFFIEADKIIQNSQDKKFKKIKQEIRKRKLKSLYGKR